MSLSKMNREMLSLVMYSGLVTFIYGLRWWCEITDGWITACLVQMVTFIQVWEGRDGVTNRMITTASCTLICSDA